MSSINKIVNRIVDAGLAIAVAVVFIVTFLQVISRFVFRLPIPWSTDVIRLAFIYTVFLGAAIGMREKGHLNVDVLFNALPDKVRKITGIGINLLILAFLLIVFRLGMQFTQSGLSQMAPYIRMSMATYYFCVPLSAILMFYYLIQYTIEDFRNLKSRP